MILLAALEAARQTVYAAMEPTPCGWSSPPPAPWRKGRGPGQARRGRGPRGGGLDPGRGARPPAERRNL